MRARNTWAVVAQAQGSYARAKDSALMQVTLAARDGKHVRLPDGRRVTEFVSCCYLGLDTHADVIAGAKAALDDWGVHLCCARSRFSIGPLGELEAGLSRLFGGHAVTFPSVTSAHMSVLPLLASGVLFADAAAGEQVKRPVRMVFDRLAHASMQYLRPICAEEAAVEVVAHNDLVALEALAKDAQTRGERLVYLADGVYSMGGVCPLARVVALAEQYDFHVYIDDAHGISIFGAHGEGFAASVLGRPLPARVFLAFSLAKGFGCNGGGVVLPNARAEALLRAFGQTYAFSGPLDFAVVGGALAALRLHESGEVAARQRVLAQKIALFTGRDEPHASPIQMVPVASVEQLFQLGEWLLQRGYFASVAFFPVVARDAPQLRVCITSAHADEEILGLRQALDAFFAGTQACA